jgi:hypothetical protein
MFGTFLSMLLLFLSWEEPATWIWSIETRALWFAVEGFWDILTLCWKCSIETFRLCVGNVVWYLWLCVGNVVWYLLSRCQEPLPVHNFAYHKGVLCAPNITQCNVQHYPFHIKSTWLKVLSVHCLTLIRNYVGRGAKWWMRQLSLFFLSLIFGPEIFDSQDVNSAQTYVISYCSVTSMTLYPNFTH